MPRRTHWLKLYGGPLLLLALGLLSLGLSTLLYAAREAMEPIVAVVSPWLFSRRGHHYVYAPEDYAFIAALPILIGFIWLSMAVWSAKGAPGIERRLDRQLAGTIDEIEARNTRTLDEL